MRYSTHDHPMAPVAPVARVVAHKFLGVHPDSVDWVRPLGLVVGEQPGAGSNPLLPMWPWPSGRAGGRLLAMSGMEAADYLVRLARVNLAFRPVARWSVTQARKRMSAVLETLEEGDRVVLCGAKVRDACAELEGAPWFSSKTLDTGVSVVAVPHPSGRCREYNAQPARRQAGQWIRWAARIGTEED